MDQNQSRGVTRGRRGRGEAFYRRVLSEQEASGQSLRSFAVERGLSPWTLYGWRGRLRRGRPRRARGAFGKQKGPSFVAVDVVGTCGLAADIEVVLADGCRVRVPRDIELERLAELVRVLRSC